MDSEETVLEILHALQKDMEYIKSNIRHTDPEPVENMERESPVDISLCADLFKALANEERLKLLTALRKEGQYFSQLIQLTSLAHSPLRFHLTVLKDVNLIDQERFRGKYMITDLGIQSLSIARFFCLMMNKESDENEGIR